MAKKIFYSLKIIKNEELAYQIFQIFITILLFIITLPLYLLVIPAIWIDSGRPFFYVHKRVGKDGQIFKLYKFRTMEKDAEKYTGALLRSEIDQITRVGRILRVLKIDEIPQFVNIFKRDMNLVGPRPERPIIYNKLINIISDYSLRNKLKPGLTNPAQLYTPYNTPRVKRFEYDLYYINNRSIIFDIKIIIETINYIIIRFIKLIQGKSEENIAINKINITEIENINKPETKILIFENNLLELINLKTILRKEGYIFLAIDNINDIYDKAKLECPDLIICNLFLDNDDHINLCNLLKNDKYTASIPIIILTNSKRKEDFLIARELFVDEYITKPITHQKLKEIIRKILVISNTSSKQT